jgi:hypothetical protein
VIHVYGIVDELDSLPSLAGLDDAPLERRYVEGLEFVVSDASDGEVTQQAVLRHAQVVEELMARSAGVLPAQFSRGFGDEGELEAAVRMKARELRRGLSRVRGCVEFGLRAVVPAGRTNEPSAPSGAEYMQARLAQERQRAELVAKLDKPLARLSRAAAPAPRSSGTLFESAYLVSEENVAEFTRAVRRLEAAFPELTVVCTGPWPPYSFGASPEGPG